MKKLLSLLFAAALMLPLSGRAQNECVATLPFFESFETCTTNYTIPQCWTRPAVFLHSSAATYPGSYTLSNFASHGATGMCLNSNGGNSPNFLVSPAFVEHVDRLSVVFHAYQSGTPLNFSAGIMTNPADTSSFIPILSFTSMPTTFNEYEFSTNGVEFEGDTVWIAWRLTSGSAYLDEISISMATSCPRPASAIVSDIDSASVTASWTSVQSAQGYVVSWGTCDDCSASTTDTSLSIEDLVPSTAYTLSVSAICDEGDTTMPTLVDFRTACGEITLPWIETFDSYTAGSGHFPDCMTAMQVNGFYPYIYNSTSYAHSGSNCLYLYPSATSPNMVCTPRIPIDATDIRVEFYARLLTNAGDLEAGVVTNPTDASTFIPLLTVSPSENGNTTKHYKFYTDHLQVDGQVYIAFRKTGSGAAALDDILVREAENCRPVEELRVSAASDEEVSIVWNSSANASSYIISLGDETEFTTQDTTYTFDELVSGLIYTATVRAYCGVDDTAESSSVAVRLIPRPADLPYFTGFEENEDAGWDFINGLNAWYIGSAISNGGQRSMYVSNDNGQSNAYSTGSISYSYAYRSLNVTDTGEYTFSLDWRAYGESTWDYIRVFLTSATEQYPSTSLPGGITSTTSFSSTVPSGWIDLVGGKLNLMGVWQSEERTVRINQTGAYNLLFIWCNDGGGGSMPPAAVDNIYFGRNSCPAPTGFAASDILTDQMTLSWHPGGEETEWALYVNGELYQTLTDTSITLTELNGSAMYTFELMAVCGAEDSSRRVLLMASTPSTPVAEFPYSTGFEANDDAGWDFINGVNGWFIGSAEAHTGSRSLYISNNNGQSYNYTNGTMTTSYAIRTLSISDEGEYQIGFDWKANGEGSYDFLRAWITPHAQLGTLTAGMLPNGSTSTNSYTSTTPTGWTDLVGGKLNLQSSWQTAFSSVNLTPGMYDIVLMWCNDGSGGSNPPAAIDNFYIDQLTCPAPSEFFASEVTGNSITLNWHPVGEETQWAVRNGTGDIVLVTDTFYTFSGLQALTQYDLRVRAVCGNEDSSRWVSFLQYTICDTVITHNDLPFTENFNSYSSSSLAPIGCWSKINYAAMSGIPYPYSAYAHGTGNSLYFYPDAGEGYVYAITPEFEDVDELMVNFYMYSYNYSTARMTVGIMTSASDTSTFVPLQEFSLSENSVWEEFSLPLLGYTTGSNGRIAFRASSTSGSSAIYLDDVEILVAPSCMRPTAISIGSVSTDEATLMLVDPTNVGSYVAYISSSNGVDTIEFADTTLLLSNLVAQTEYTVAVASVCDDGTLTSTISTSFRTLCVGIAHADLPWTENFNSYPSGTDHPATDLVCWSALNLYTGSWAYPYIVGFNHSGTGASIIFSDGSGTSATHPVLALPAFEDSISSLKFTCWFYGVAGVVEVGYITNPSQASSFVPTDTVPVQSSWAEREFRFPEEAQGCIAIRYAQVSGNFYIDDITVSFVEGGSQGDMCYMPTGLTVSQQNEGSAIVSWTSTATDWELEVNGEVRQVSTNPYTLTGLSAGTQYSIRVRAICSETSSSSWTAAVSFTPSSVGLTEGEASAVRLYPNPTEGRVNVQTGSRAKVEVVDMNGRTVVEGLSGGNISFDMSRMGAGAYFVRVVREEGVGVRKLVVK